MTQEDLQRLLEYDSNTGVFRWKVARKRGMLPGEIAGWHSGKNAWRIEVFGKNYLAHRLAWFYVYGSWPDQIDHINGNRSDNRLCNLREANNSQNQANMKAKSNNRIGIRGLGFKRNKYVVQLRKTKKDGVVFVSQNFSLLCEAVKFVRTKSKELHGEFSIFNR